MSFKVRIFRGFTRVGLALVVTASASSALADEKPKESRSWQATLGVGAANMPEYPGSADSEIRALPLINVRYKRVFLGGAPGASSTGGLGVYLYDGESLSLGAIASPGTMDPRKESDDVRLRGLGNIDATTRAGLFTTYRIGWLTLSASAMTDVGDKQQGTIANFDAEVTYRLFKKLVLSGGPGVSWTNQEYMQTFFGITNAQATNSTFAPYTPASGVSVARVSFGAQYLLSPRWFLGARVTAAQLQGDAADSPIVAEKNQNLYALFFGYRF
jgi:outer membrane protein